MAVLSAIESLFANDLHLLEIDASERAIAARLALYLQNNFPNMDVDVEYNRMGDAPKRVAWSDDKSDVFPDIIIHIRGEKTNLLAIEIKKDSNRETKDKDLQKLRAYRWDDGLEYQAALFMRFGTGACAGSVTECEWVAA